MLHDTQKARAANIAIERERERERERGREREREAKEHSRDTESWVPHADITILALGQSDGVGLPGWAEVIAGDVTTKSGVGSQFNYKQNAFFIFTEKKKAYTQTKTAFPTRNHNSSTGTAARQPESGRFGNRWKTRGENSLIPDPWLVASW